MSLWGPDPPNIRRPQALNPLQPHSRYMTTRHCDCTKKQQRQGIGKAETAALTQLELFVIYALSMIGLMGTEAADSALTSGLSLAVQCMCSTQVYKQLLLCVGIDCENCSNIKVL